MQQFKHKEQRSIMARVRCMLLANRLVLQTFLSNKPQQCIYRAKTILMHVYSNHLRLSQKKNARMMGMTAKIQQAINKIFLLLTKFC